MDQQGDGDGTGEGDGWQPADAQRLAVGEEGDGGEGQEEQPPPDADATLEETIQEAQDAYADAQEAYADGDWEAYADAQQRLQEALERLGQKLTKNELGGWEISLKAGSVDDAVDTEEEAFERARRFLSYMPSSIDDLPPRGPRTPFRMPCRTSACRTGSR